MILASCGDYSYEDYPDHTYLSSYRFVPQQDHAMQRKIMDNHKKHVWVAYCWFKIQIWLII